MSDISLSIDRLTLYAAKMSPREIADTSYDVAEDNTVAEDGAFATWSMPAGNYIDVSKTLVTDIEVLRKGGESLHTEDETLAAGM